MITNLIDRDRVGRVLRKCCHYDDIIDYEEEVTDSFSLGLIEWYKDIIFDSDIDDNDLTLLDKCIYFYTIDNKYRIKLERLLGGISSFNGIDTLDKIIECYKNYEEQKIYSFTSSRWI